MTTKNDLFPDVSNWIRTDPSDDRVSDVWINTKTGETLRSRDVRGPFPVATTKWVLERKIEDNDWEAIYEGETATTIEQKAYGYAKAHNYEEE